MTDRIVEKLDIEDCGCYTQRITETWMGEIVVAENYVVCSEHW